MSHASLEVAYLILAREVDIIRRVLTRTDIETSLAVRRGKYPFRSWLKLYRVLDLKRHYRSIVEALERLGLGYKAMTASHGGFMQVTDIGSFLDDMRMDDDEFESVRESFFPDRLID